MIGEEASSSSDKEWAFLVKEHKVYSYLGRCLFIPLDSDIPLISETIRASSTDINFTEHGPSGIENSRYGNDISCWSSKGERDPKVPATLIYRLGSRLCFVNEIRLQPFQAKFQPGNPIYSAKAVRFRMGHSLLDPDEDRPYPLPQSKRYRSNPLYGSDKEFVWSYVSPEFPMAQRNELQTFKLPRPALCIGGFLQVELLGRVQVHPSDNLYRICICNVEAIGQPLSTFDVYIDLKSGGSILQYYSEVSVSYEHHPDLNNHLLFGRVENIHFEKLYSNEDDDDDV